MEKENISHIQGGFYHVGSMDYYISLNQKTLEKVKEGNIIKSKIVFSSHDYEQNKRMIQKKLFITLLTDSERRENKKETKIIRTSDEVRLKISEKLLDTLIKENPQDYEHRYDNMQNKIHFLIDETERPLNEKQGFDDTFQFCEKLNKKLPEQLDMFESDYINVYNPEKDKK